MSAPFPRRSSLQGLSLLEVMFAMAILAFGMLALMVGMTRANELNGFNKRVTIAEQDLQRLTEALVAAPWPPAENGFPNTSAGAPSSITSGGSRGLDLDGDGALGAGDLLLTLPQELMWVEYFPLAESGPMGAAGDTGSPLQVQLFVRWTEPDGQSLTRSVITVVAD